jgi:uncharacterized protein YbcI
LAAQSGVLMRKGKREIAEDGQRTGGQLNAALAAAVVRIHNRYLGRGPSKGQAFFRDRVVVVIMEEVLTKAERSLVEAGRGDQALSMRHEFQNAMKDDLVDAVEGLTGRKVEVFMSDNHLMPDMAAELFVLDRPVPGEPTASGGTTGSEGSAGTIQARPGESPRRSSAFHR